jgi:hypothetical protein
MMKNKFVRNALFLLMLTAGTTAGAQNLSDVLSSVASQVSKVTTTTDAVSVIGKSKVTAKQLAGTWSYSKPAVAFESDQLLSKAGGAIAARTIENRLADELSRYGIKAGALKFTFTGDGQYTCTLGKREVSGTYTLSGASVIFGKDDSETKVKANAKVGKSSLQLTFTADKMLQLLQQFGAQAGDSRLKTIANLAKNYSGMQLGLKLSRAK